MKKTFGRNLILFILIVMFTLCMAVGCTTLTADPVSDTVTYNDESSIKITRQSDVLGGAEGSQLQLDFEVKMKNDDDPKRKWGTIDFYLNSDQPDLWELSNFANGLPYQYEEGSPFDDQTRYTTNVSLSPDDEKGFLHFSMTTQYERAVEATNDVKFSIALKLNQDVDTEGTTGLTANFDILKLQENVISSYIYVGTEQAGRFDALNSGNKDKGLNVEQAKTDISITEIDDVVTLKNMSIIDTTLESNQTITYIEDTVDKQDRPFVYNSANAAKDKINLHVEPSNAGAKIMVQIAELTSGDPDATVVPGSTGIIYALKAGNIESLPIPLSKAHQIIYINVQSADGKHQLPYEIRFNQSYIGLEKFDVETNNKVEDVTKEGLTEDSTFEPNKTEYTMYAPVGKNGATKVEITPAVAAGYGASDQYTVEGDGITGSLNFRSGFAHSYTIPNANNLKGGEEFNLTYTFTGSNGNRMVVKLKVIAVSVDTTLTGVTLANDETNDDDNAILSLVDGKYESELLKEANYRSLISFAPTAGEKATAMLYQGSELLGGSGLTIGVADNNIDKPFDRNEVFNYEIVVTAEAGNVTRYPLILKKRIVSGKIVSLEYSTKQSGDGSGFDWTGAVPLTKEINGFDPTSTDAVQNITLNLPDFTVSRIAFRVKVTDGAEIRTVGLASRVELAGATNNKEQFATYSFVAQYLRQGITEVDITTYSSADLSGIGCDYKINIVRTETNYDITNIALNYRDTDGSRKNLITNFSDLNSDLDIKNDPSLEQFKLPNIPFSVSEIEMRVYTNGNSTVVYVNGRQITRIANNDTTESGSPIPGDTVHTYTLQLDPGRETIVEIVSKGTDGIKEDAEKDENYTIRLTRAAAKSINTLESLKAYLKANVEVDGVTELKYIDKQGKPVDDKNDAQIITSFNANTNYYYCEIGELVAYDYIEIEAAVPENSGATMSGALGNVHAQAPAGAERTYTISVKPENSKLGLGINDYHIIVLSNTPQPSNVTEITQISMHTNQAIDLLSDLKNGIPQGTTTKTEPHKVTVNYSNSAITIFTATADKTTRVKIIKIVDPDAAIDYDKSNIEYDDNGYIKLDIGDNLFLITSFAQDDTQGKNYFFNINRKQANPNVDLKSLQVMSAMSISLLHNFNTNVFDYYVSVPAGEQGARFIRFVAEANNNVDATIRLYADGRLLVQERNALNYSTPVEMMLAPGDSRIFNIEIEADGTKKSYNIFATRQYDFGYLTEMVVTAADSRTGEVRTISTENSDYGTITKDNISAAIAAGVRDFFVTVPYETSNVHLHATSPASMRISFDGEKDFDVQDLFGSESTTFSYPFTVSSGLTDGHGDTNFNFHITREQKRSSNTFAEITEFKIAELADFNFDATIVNYKFVVGYEVKSITEIIKFNTDKQYNPTYTMSVNGGSSKELICGMNNIVFTFTSADHSKTDIVYVSVERKHASVAGVTITDKTSNTAIDTGISIEDGIDAYSFTVANSVESLNLNLSLAEGYTMNVVGKDTLEVGTNKMSVEIKDTDGKVVRTIVFNVYREQADPDYTVWYIVAGVLGGVVLILLILTIVAFVTRSGRSSKRGGNINDSGLGDFALD